MYGSHLVSCCIVGRNGEYFEGAGERVGVEEAMSTDGREWSDGERIGKERGLLLPALVAIVKGISVLILHYSLAVL